MVGAEVRFFCHLHTFAQYHDAILLTLVTYKVYCTVGSEEKVKHLTDHCGIPAERSFNSRNTSFLQDVMKATNGRGVDLVLNSLSGELLHASWQCVARYGKMLEIGKRDLLGNGRLNLNPFLANRTFYGVDLATMLNDDLQDVRK